MLTEHLILPTMVICIGGLAFYCYHDPASARKLLNWILASVSISVFMCLSYVFGYMQSAYYAMDAIRKNTDRQVVIKNIEDNAFGLMPFSNQVISAIFFLFLVVFLLYLINDLIFMRTKANRIDSRKHDKPEP